MKQWYQEDWEFTVKVEKVGRDNKPTNYRMGYEPGFVHLPVRLSTFCSKSMLKLFLILEAVRSGEICEISAALTNMRWPSSAPTGCAV